MQLLPTDLNIYIRWRWRLLSFYGQCCRRHVVGQRVMSDICVVPSYWSLCFELNDTKMLPRLHIAALGTSILLHLANITWPTTWWRVGLLCDNGSHWQFRGQSVWGHIVSAGRKLITVVWGQPPWSEAELPVRWSATKAPWSWKFFCICI